MRRVQELACSLRTELEACAAESARLAGGRIVGTPHDSLAVQFKAAGGRARSNPVCDVDREVESDIRALLAARFPGHAVVGEEGRDFGHEGAEFVWVIDPLDGTTNYLNGLPLYAASIGVLWRGVPVAGASWCAASHALRPGVYHASAGRPLHFDGAPLARRCSGEWRELATEPGRAPRYAGLFETRVLASAALECAFVAAGLLQLAFLSGPRAWDVTAGIVLARAAGCRILTRSDGRWRAFEDFTTAGALPRLRRWREPMLIGAPDAIERALHGVPC